MKLIFIKKHRSSDKFEAKKNYFEYNIRRQKSLIATDNKGSLTPSTMRHSSRKKNDQLIPSSSQSSSNEQIIFEQFRYRFGIYLKVD